MPTPKISVIVPIYGVEQYIERCARTLFEQTLDDIEYLFIDDCTPDKSIEILRRVLEDYPYRKPQTIIHRMEQNSGQAKVREWGMRNSSGEYIVHCDSDDWVGVDMYRTMYEKAVENESDIVLCDYFVHDGTNTTAVFEGCRSVGVDEVLTDILYQNIAGSLWNKLVKASLYANYLLHPQHNMGEDTSLCSQLVYYTEKITHVHQPLYYYYSNPDSIVRKRDAASIINKYNQFATNISLIESFATHHGVLHRYERGLVWLRYSALSALVIKEPQCMALFRQNFSSKYLILLLDKHVNTTHKKQLLKDLIKILFWR